MRPITDWLVIATMKRLIVYRTTRCQNTRSHTKVSQGLVHTEVLVSEDAPILKSTKNVDLINQKTLFTENTHELFL